MRVLVIEDDAILGRALHDFLIEQGYAVDWLESGEQAPGAIGGQAYDVVLLDLNLPGIGGLEVLRQIVDAWQREKYLARQRGLPGLD